MTVKAAPSCQILPFAQIKASISALSASRTLP
jgi:hypothetical protein